MKVIKPGSLNSPTWEVTCKGEDGDPGCGAVLGVTLEDLFISIWGSGIDDYNDEQRVTVLCPQCGSTTSNVVKLTAATLRKLRTPKHEAVEKARENVRKHSKYTPPKTW